VKDLTRLGVDVNAHELVTGNTALHYAATTNCVELCKHLVGSAADVNARNEAGETALFAAARRNHWHTTLFLLLVRDIAMSHTHSSNPARLMMALVCERTVHRAERMRTPRTRTANACSWRRRPSLQL
jgi:ankyrin repeat protein